MNQSLILSFLILISSNLEPDTTRAKVNLQSPGIAVIELFTSQGCSSCPAADRLLQTINKEYVGKSVYTLSFHVNYWNYLGWEDPYSREEFTQRQRQYASRLKSQVYTPMMVVNGRQDFTGSNERIARAAISESLEQTKTVDIELSTDLSAEGKIKLSYQIDNSIYDQDDLTLNVAMLLNNTKNNVSRGENRGKTLSHTNVVVSFSQFEARDKGHLILTPPMDKKPEDLSIIAFAQHNITGHIIGAEQIKLFD